MNRIEKTNYINNLKKDLEANNAMMVYHYEGLNVNQLDELREKMRAAGALLKVTKNTDALSIVMGHEIAHAVARHSVERMSHAMTINLGTSIADIFLGGAINRTRNTVGQNTGLDIFQLGVMNPFGRKQETEADYLGLIFSSLSGYDIRESIKLWQRMAEKNKGKETPVFLSTHPSSKKRIENLKNWINEVMIKYPPIKV